MVNSKEEARAASEAGREEGGGGAPVKKEAITLESFKKYFPSFVGGFIGASLFTITILQVPPPLIYVYLYTPILKLISFDLLLLLCRNVCVQNFRRCHD